MKLWMALALFVSATDLFGQPYQRPGSKSDYLSPNRDLLLNRTAAAYEREFTKIRGSADRLIKSAATNNAETVALLKESVTHSEFLRGRWQDWLKNNSRFGQYSDSPTFDKYLQSLTRDGDLLKQAEDEKDPARALETIRSVTLDLEVKASNCRNSADGLGKVIRVKVLTKSETQEVTGYEVYFVPRGMYGVKSAYDRFRKLSSPTDERDLSPGIYALWVRKGEQESKPVSMRIGGKGDTKLEIDLAVP
jgi:hypothetical protein